MAGRGLAHMGLRVGGRAAGEVYRGRQRGSVGWRPAGRSKEGEQVALLVKLPILYKNEYRILVVARNLKPLSKIQLRLTPIMKWCL
jgi:hypothetical protein